MKERKQSKSHKRAKPSDNNISINSIPSSSSSVPVIRKSVKEIQDDAKAAATRKTSDLTGVSINGCKFITLI